MDEVDVVVVGGGQAGVSVSHYLRERRIDHVVLERDRPFSSWRDRWDGFVANTPNWMNTLPPLDEDVFPSGDPGAFATRDEFLEYFQECLEAADPPIRTGVAVERVSEANDGTWSVETSDGGYRAQCVVICTGAMSTPRLPAAAEEVPEHVPQIHSSQYRSPDQITTGSVLIVGSASSGVQICRLLGESGRFDDIHMAVSKVTVLPKSVFGVQIHRLIHAFGLFDVRSDSWVGKIMYSTLEDTGDPITRPGPKGLARSFGVHLYGKFIGVEGSLLRFADDQSLESGDLTIIWCTGFRPGFDFLDVDGVLGGSGHPRHVRGVVDSAPGLYFVGLRYQHTIASHDIYGVGRDAQFVADRIAERVAALDMQAGKP